MITTFVVSYGTNTLGVDRGVMVNATLVAAAFQILVTVFAGRLGEKFGAGRMTVIGGLLTAVAAFPMFWLIDTKNPLAIIVAVTVGIAIVTIAYAVTGALLTELFPPELRYSGVALGYNIAGALTGFLPLIATAFLAASGNASWSAALILIVISLITVLGGALGERLRITDKAIVE